MLVKKIWIQKKKWINHRKKKIFTSGKVKKKVVQIQENQ